MSQKTNLNVSPYFDDFNSEKNFYKVLFNPGRPIQARELNNIQSILQNQIESFGSHIFKEGSVVIPGNLTYDPQYYAVKLNPSTFGVDILLYIDQYVGKKITGQITGISANIQKIEIPDNVNGLEYITLYVKYLDGDSNFTLSQFQDGESLSCNEDVIYGNTTIFAGTPFASLISTGATSIGSAASIGDGIYFVRGTFVRVTNDTVILDYYTNTPSYRVGLKVSEEIITAKEDSSLYDNAKGFNNYAAPGADRFKIGLTLTKKTIDSVNTDTDFIELLRIENGQIKKVKAKTDYSILRDYLAQRTFDESGNYSVDPFKISLHNSLNDRLGNDGLFFENEKTEEGNTPNDDLMCIKISPGKAYVKGYDIEKLTTTILDIDKPRETIDVSNISIPFEMGNLLRVNNVFGSPKQNKPVELHSLRRKTSGNPDPTSKIGDARVYNYRLTDSAYVDQTSNWDLYLYDIQTYTKLTLNQSLSSTELPQSSFIKGKSSNASGYAVSSGDGTEIIKVTQTSGTFIQGEQIIINGIESIPRTISSIRVYNFDDIKQIYQPTSISGFTTSFLSDTVLEKFTPPGFDLNSTISITSNVVTSPGKSFSSIKPDTIIIFQKPGSSLETFNRVVSVNPVGSSMVVDSVADVAGICTGSVTNVSGLTFSIGSPTIRNNGKASLYSELPNPNVSSVSLNNSLLNFTAQSTQTLSTNSPEIVLNVTDFSLPSGITTALFLPFDVENYSVHYTDGSTEKLSSDKFTLLNNQITLTNLTPGKTTSVINASFVKTGIQSKVKEFNRSGTLNVIYSKNPQSGVGINTSLNDGLIYNKFYGLRVQDEKICLNYPDVIKVLAIYESLDTLNPVLDELNFSALANIGNNAIIGENIIGSSSNAIARVVTRSSNSVGIVYLNSERFILNELVIFEESNINSEIDSITLGKYNNVTNNYTLDRGQKDQYYDYSSIIRNPGAPESSRRLLVVFDYYSVPVNDNGDVFTVLSYNKERFTNDIPNLGVNNIRSTDTLDFRPRVPVFTGISSSPFDYSSRDFSSTIKLNLSPDDNSIIGYSYYTGRIDKIYLDKSGEFVYLKGVSSRNSIPPTKIDDNMELATISLPPYLYTPKEASISLVDNRRYTMRDIGSIESRVTNLERVTSLSLLELNTQTLQITDNKGLNRFKSGFFVDDFKDSERINTELSLVEVDLEAEELTPIISRNSLKNYLAPSEEVSDENIDLSTNYTLIDPNIQKSGESITLKYNSVSWISQPLATSVENVNPFNVVSYDGIVKLSPSTDTWVRTVQLPDKTVSITDYVFLQTNELVKKKKVIKIPNNGVKLVETKISIKQKNRSTSSSDTTTTSENNYVGSKIEEFMRSRNTEFSVSNLKPFTQYYQFLDGNSGVDFVPKLIEIATDSTLQNYGSSGTFQVGETVVGSIYSSDSGSIIPIIEFRVATPNHKFGEYNNPKSTYLSNPYIKTETIPSSYSSSSKILNVDTYALSQEAQGLYSGYIVKGMILVGKTSGAVAYVKDRRLISDDYGDLVGTFFLRDSNSNPPPSVRINTGTKTYKVTSSPTNEIAISGDDSISSAETNYKSEGTLELYENLITNTTTVTTKTTTTTVVKKTTTYFDPLAQSFSVGGSGTPNDDENGIFITSVDIFFKTKDSGNAPLTVQMRTMELGTPTRTVLGNPVVLRPDQIQTSDDASVPTKVTFDYPIYLEPNNEYAVVLLAPESNQYRVFIAEMGKVTIETQNLPDSSSVTYSQQFALGSLFKSQNGSIWSASQYQDMKFTLYRAEFSTTPGVAYFYNPTLDKSNGYVKNLLTNPLTVLPKKLSLGITTTTDSGIINVLKPGRKVTESTRFYNYGYIESTGCSVSSVGITTSGENYINFSNVSTYNIVGNGSGLKLDITTNGGKITNASISSNGNGTGYVIGDVVGIVTSSAGNTGSNARITITGNNNGIDTLYLSEVQGEYFTSGGTSNLVYYNDSGVKVPLTSIFVTNSTPYGEYFKGNYIKVDHFNHGMYGKNNKLELSGVLSNVPPTSLVQDLTTSSTVISVANTSNFGTFEGIPVSQNNPGYVIIDSEIIKYTNVTITDLEGIERGQDSQILNHYTGASVIKYELNGISLRRINTVHDISDNGLGIDSYYIEIDRSENGVNREFDIATGSQPNNTPQVSFTRELSCGGSNIFATENIQFDTIIPYHNILSPGAFTSVSAKIRTISGTSVSGNEASFVDQGYEDVQLNTPNKLSSTRLICSRINEQTYLTNLPRNKSFTTAITLSTTNKHLSPQIFVNDSFTDYRSNRINSPISNYAGDGRVNSLLDDPHMAIYVSKTINLAQPANSLKLIVSAYRHSSADFRALYSLIRPDSSEIEQTFELFPGYDNLTIDSNKDGFLDVVDPSKNSGLPDVEVLPSLDNQFLEYEFSANNLGKFTGYTIKIVMSSKNQAYPVKIKDLRSIATI